MGECGCGSLQPRKVLKIGNDSLCVEIYRGCEYCSTGIIVSLYFFEGKGEPYLTGHERKDFKPSEHGHQIDFPIIGKEDLIKAIETLNYDDITMYDSLIDLFQDMGLEILQEALKNRLSESFG